MSGLRVAPEVVEEVRVRGLAYLSASGKRYPDLAHLTGYSLTAVKMFFSDADGRTDAVFAQVLVDHLPDLGRGLVCRECGRLNSPNHRHKADSAHFVFRR